MKNLIDYTKILRSKNAGPLFITFDLIFYNNEDMQYIYQNLKKGDVAKRILIKERKKNLTEGILFLIRSKYLQCQKHQDKYNARFYNFGSVFHNQSGSDIPTQHIANCGGKSD